MRKLKELKMDEGERPFTAGEVQIREPPSDEQIRAFESYFGVTLPDDYISFLKFSNGGHPQLSCFVPIDYGDLWSINLFYHLSADIDDSYSVWINTKAWEGAFPHRIIPIANNGCDDQIVLSYDTEPPNIKICLHEGGQLINGARSFSDFIDMLKAEPDD